MWFTKRNRAAAVVSAFAAAAAAAIFAFERPISSLEREFADLVIINANIRTLDPKQPRAEALAVSAGRIAEVGRSDDLRKYIGPKTEVIDGGGRLVLPGFNDAHVHFTAIGNQFSHIDLQRAATKDEVLRRLKYFASMVPRGRWLIGAGIREDLSFGDPEGLDSAAPEHPVLLYYAIPKRAAVNSRALKAAGLGPANAVVSGDGLVRLQNAIPRDRAANWAEIAETASNLAASLGVTSVQDMHSDDLAEVLNELDRQGKLKTRVYDCIGIEKYRDAIARGLKAGQGNAMVRGGCLKGMTEGGPDDIEELTPVVIAADKAGIQIALHAIGGRAVAGALTIFEDAVKKNGERDRRFRVEHAARFRTADITRFVRGGFVASMQPYLFYNGPEIGDDHAALLSAGVRLALGSDASMVELDPLLGIHASVNSGRRSISVEEAVRAYTLGSAFAEFSDTEKGTLTQGKLADLVILSDDIFTIDRNRIRDARVMMTVLGGNVVFRREMRAGGPS